MKHLIASTLVLLPLMTLAAAPAPAAKKTAAKLPVAAKAPAKKPVAKAPAARSKKAAVAGTAAAATAAAAAAAAVDQPLGPEALEIAQRVHTGDIGCELGKRVSVQRDSDKPGYFKVSGHGFNFHMSPVATSTGAVRLEDTRAGAVWLQIANKSMLMNQKVGQRLADECMSPEQMQVAEAMKTTPAPNLLEGTGGR